MPHPIRDVEIHDVSITAALAELHITVSLDPQMTDVEVRGRVLGPSCPYANTIEVAYAFQPLPQPTEVERKHYRVVIPEASLWDMQSPFLYTALLEARRAEQRLQQVRLSHGLRRLTLGTQGLAINGKPFTIKGLTLTECSDAHARTLHQQGYNAWLTPAQPTAAPLGEMAARWGFLVLGKDLLVTTEKEGVESAGLIVDARGGVRNTNGVALGKIEGYP